ncbi:FAS-associated factor 2-B (UBX domain-containing protein 8-B) [Durusdinium trenchii]|uniref:FAS-associated factor 2-B (UBX domain-containing protein 8-B) n=1 Tax=Durusdinium trenchii TaxID=1381693 RepID=A0ABP0KTS5_9DINO
MADETLSAEQRRLLEQLAEVTDRDNADQQQRRRNLALLRAHNWNLDRALAASFEDDHTPAPELLGQSSSVRHRRTRSEDRSGDGDPAGGNRETQHPSSDSTRNDSAGVMAPLANLLLTPLRILTGFNGEVDTQTAVEVFVKDLNEKFVERRKQGARQGAPEGELALPNFVQMPYREALAEASRSEKLLLVYLHSPQHPDSGPFCDVLAMPEVSRLINDRMVAWGGCVEYAEAYRLCTLLDTATFPYLAVLEPPSDPQSTNAKLLECMEGALEFGLVLSKLTHATDQHGAIIAERVARRHEANERQRLRQEQDEALQQAMEEDRRKEEERRRKAEEERRAEEEEAIAREREEEERRRIEAEQQAKVQALRESMPPEPELVRGEVSTIRFKLPDGGGFQRRFPNGATLAELRNFVDFTLHERGSSISNYAIVQTFPKKAFGPDDDQTSTLADNGWSPQAALFIQDLDS